MTSRKVLVIDDAETMRRAVVDALTPAGFTVLTARDGFHGVAAMKETHDLCLVIIDLNMPGMSGFGVLDWMRKDRSPHLPPAVFMTTEVSESALAQAKNAGAVGWLIKPCRADQLVSVVNRVLAKRGKRMEAKVRSRVVCVDDEPHVLSGLSLHLRRRYDVETATSGAAALELLARQPQAAVVISDMRMPGMNGAEFLAKASTASPHTTRILLTGHAEVDSAIAAVNKGAVFRFLVKPCPPPELLSAIDAAVELHRVTVAEQHLLEQTLHGSIKMLTEVMSLTNPVAFGRAQRLKQHVTSLAEKMELTERWQVEVAAMLSQLSTFTLPPETLEKVHYGAPLTGEEQAMVERAPDVTEQLLSHIPRLEPVREILGAYTKPYRKPERPADVSHEQQQVQRWTQMLRVAADFDTLEAQGLSTAVALTTLKGRTDQYEPEVMSAFLSLFGQRREGDKIRDISLAALRSGMVLAADVKMSTGTLFVARGYEITPAFLERVRNFRPGSVREPIKVLIRAA